MALCCRVFCCALKRCRTARSNLSVDIAGNDRSVCLGVSVRGVYDISILAMSCAKSFWSSAKYGSCSDVMHAFKTSVDMNSRTSDSTGPSPVNSGTIERRTLAIIEHARVSRMRSAWVQNKTTGFKISDVWSMKILAVSWASVSSISKESCGIAAIFHSVFCHYVDCCSTYQV